MVNYDTRPPNSPIVYGAPLLVPLGSKNKRYGDYGQAGISVGLITNATLNKHGRNILANFEIFRKLHQECPSRGTKGATYLHLSKKKKGDQEKLRD